MSYREAAEGARIEGICRRPVNLVSGRFVLIERARDFTLVATGAGASARQIGLRTGAERLHQLVDRAGPERADN
jgi:hypothetical protein